MSYSFKIGEIIVATKHQARTRTGVDMNWLYCDQLVSWSQYRQFISTYRQNETVRRQRRDHALTRNVLQQTSHYWQTCGTSETR